MKIQIYFFHNDENSIAESLGEIQLEKNNNASISDSENNGKKLFNKNKLDSYKLFIISLNDVFF